MFAQTKHAKREPGSESEKTRSRGLNIKVGSARPKQNNHKSYFYKTTSQLDEL